MELHDQIQKYKFNFIANRYTAFIVSVVLIVLGMGSVAMRGGLKWGIDFVGGTIVEVRFSEVPDINVIRKTIEAANFKNPTIQRLGDGELILIRVQGLQSKEGGDEGGQIRTVLEGLFEKDRFEIRRVEQIGPQVGSELRKSAQLALLFAIAGMMLYISWRFEAKIALPVAIIAVITIGLSSWNVAISALIIAALIAVLGACVVFGYPYSFAAIVALIHDVLITVGFLSLTDREMSLPVVASLLTIIGYSINDTIVVFDRIRENTRLMARAPADEMLDTSIHQTLSRTILTSLTTLLVVFVLWVAGGHVINTFAFALLVGISIGTYSSIFVATPILYEWNMRTKGGVFKRT